MKIDLALPAKQLSVHCMALLCPIRVHDGSTNTLLKQITALHLLLLLKAEQKEAPICELVLVMFLTAVLQSTRKRPCQENSSTHNSALHELLGRRKITVIAEPRTASLQ